jgi:hypothetical protein
VTTILNVLTHFQICKKENVKWNCLFLIYDNIIVKGGYIFHSLPKGGGLLRRSRAFSATLTGRFGMGTVRMGAEGSW